MARYLGRCLKRKGRGKGRGVDFTFRRRDERAEGAVACAEGSRCINGLRLKASHFTSAEIIKFSPLFSEIWARRC